MSQQQLRSRENYQLTAVAWGGASWQLIMVQICTEPSWYIAKSALTAQIDRLQNQQCIKS